MNLLPSSSDAEQGLLCSFLLAHREVGRVCAERKVERAHFHFSAHGTIYSHLLQMWSEDKPIDFILLTNRLRDHNDLDKCGGAGFVTNLFTLIPTAALAVHYLEIIEEKRLLRQIITICSEYGDRSREEQSELPSILSEIQSKIAALGADTGTKILSMKENILDAIDTLEGRSSSDGNAVIRTGLLAFDKDIGPLERGNLLVIGGQTKAGKSMLAGQIGLNVSLAGHKVLYISLEMTERELTLRLLSILGRVDTRRVKEWDEFEHARFSTAKETLMGAHFHIVTRRFLLSEICAVSQQFAAQSGVKLGAIVLDYAQLCDNVRHGKESQRNQELAEISRTCKRLAGSLDVLFILLTQLNDDGRTKDSRAIENDANILVEVGHNKETGERGVKVVLARSAPSGQRLKLRIIPEHTRVEDAPDMNIEPQEETPKGPRRRWNK